MVDYIDTSVFVGALVEEDHSCRKYLQTVGYKSKDKGSFSHFVLSEIMKKLLTMPHVLSGLEHAARL